ncbi:MAG: DEAD/DEAH box helicase [Alphaproteobacteria bacterium]|nr:DEAD/DEAH box helicase [Alphaproteobacteria bacterium]MCW5743410.1 DEAD/DEAH box helicase [Alphaproteobacteria bacterium]
MTNFTDLGLAEPLLRALAAEGYTTPTPIQAQAIPHVAAGRDLLGIAQTGTGKTAAFALPILHRLAGAPKRAPRGGCRALILSPTRELASQIADSFRAYGRFLNMSVAVIFGGVGYGGQVRALQGGVDILVATPGRLIDHLEQRTARLDLVEIFVLDEADQMLDLGFIKPIRHLVRCLPSKRQNLFFSATMPKEIGLLADDLLTDPARVAVTPVATTVEKVEQRVILLETAQKREMLVELLGDPTMQRVLVFTRTKHGADKVVRYLAGAGIESAAIHGNKSQGQRERALGAFRDGTCRALIATDIAARGIDVEGVTHVVNFDLPNIPESYVHRIGRTARAGATGIAISFCDHEERAYLRDIERTIRMTIARTDRSGAPVAAPEPGTREQSPRPAQSKRPQHQQRRHGGGQGKHGHPPQHGHKHGRPQRQERADAPRGEHAQAERSHQRNGSQPPRREGGHALSGMNFMRRDDRQRFAGRPR